VIGAIGWFGGVCAMVLGIVVVVLDQEGGITVLGPVTVKIEGGHEENHKDEEGKVPAD
jgi:hypothetical protein